MVLCHSIFEALFLDQTLFSFCLYIFLPDSQDSIEGALRRVTGKQFLGRASNNTKTLLSGWIFFSFIEICLKFKAVCQGRWKQGESESGKCRKVSFPRIQQKDASKF